RSAARRDCARARVCTSGLAGSPVLHPLSYLYPYFQRATRAGGALLTGNSRSSPAAEPPADQSGTLALPARIAALRRTILAWLGEQVRPRHHALERQTDTVSPAAACTSIYMHESLCPALPITEQCPVSNFKKHCTSVRRRIAS